MYPLSLSLSLFLRTLRTVCVHAAVTAVCVAVCASAEDFRDDDLYGVFLRPSYQPLGLNVSSEPFIDSQNGFVALRQIAGASMTQCPFACLCAVVIAVSSCFICLSSVFFRSGSLCVRDFHSYAPTHYTFILPLCV